LARLIVLIPHISQLAGDLIFRKDYSPPLVCHLDPTGSWLPTLMDDQCSSFDEDEGWMLVWYHRHGDGMERNV